MWQEYAVQPECLVQSRDAFRALFSSFGWEHGRLLAKYPAKDWFRKVHEALERAALPPVARQWIVEKLAEERAAKQRTVSVQMKYDPALDWLVNAEAQQAVEKPFRAIVALANPRQQKDVLVEEERTDQTPLWRCEPSRSIPRTRSAFSETIAPLLVRSEQVRFIDPYFGKLERRFLDVFESLLDRIPFAGKNKIRVEYHLAVANWMDFRAKSEFARATSEEVDPMLPSSASVDFFLWKERDGGEALHDRFVLTEHGGAGITVGLDEGLPGQTTRVFRLGRTDYEKMWADYQEKTAAFGLVHKFSVGG